MSCGHVTAMRRILIGGARLRGCGNVAGAEAVIDILDLLNSNIIAGVGGGGGGGPSVRHVGGVKGGF